MNPAFRRIVCSLCVCVSITRIVVGQASDQGRPLEDPTPLSRGLEFLQSGDYPKAREMLVRAVSADPRNPLAQHALGIALLHLGEFAQATGPLERALTLSPDDTLVLNNLSAALVGSNNPVRAARHIVDFLTARPQVLEEHLADALATALNKVDAQARRGRLFSELSAFYQSYQVKLEVLRPGMKRWGYQWITAEEFAQKQEQARRQQEALVAVNRQIEVVERRLVDLRQEHARIQSRVERGWDHPWVLRVHRDRLEATEVELEGLLKQRETLMVIDAPPVHDHIAVLPLPRPRENRTQGLLPAVQPEPPPAPPQIPGRQPDPPSSSQSERPWFQEDGEPATAVGPSPAPPMPPPAPEPGHVSNPLDVQPRAARLPGTAVAFPIAADLVVTAWAPLGDGKPFSLTAADGTTVRGRVVRHDASLGLALVRIEGLRMNALSLADGFDGGQVLCVAIPQPGVLGVRVEVIEGQAKHPGGGEWRVKFTSHPGQSGAPLMSNGRVVGVAMPGENDNSDAISCITLDQLRAFVGPDARPRAHVVASDVLLQLLVDRH